MTTDLDTRREFLMQQVDDAVKEHGWYVTHVTADEQFSYTVGLVKNYHHPELLLIGLDDETAFEVLDHLHQNVAHGEVFGIGESFTMPALATVVTFHTANSHDSKHPLGVAQRYYRSEHIPVLDCRVWKMGADDWEAYSDCDDEECGGGKRSPS
jgi:hypothetical protein